MRLFPLGLAAAALILSFTGCEDDDPAGKPGPPPDGGNDEECVDEDGDGRGRYCSGGYDCDDSDPTITDECRRCRWPNEGCPCEPGTEWLSCDPPDRPTDGGVFVCTEGTRYCRDGEWTACEVIGEYVFQPD